VSDFTGWELHGNPGYRVPSRLFNGWAISGPIMGMARGALEVFTERYSAITGVPRAADAVSLQLRVAEAAAEVAAAQALHRACVDLMLETAAAGGSFSAIQRAALMRDKAYIVKLSVLAVNRLFEASGGRGTHDRDPMQRFHRDIHAASHHVQLQWDTMAEDYGRQALGLEPKGPR